MWHIDYIQLKDEPLAANTQHLGDICITQPLMSSLEEYTSVPWRHFSLAQSAIERREISLTVQDYGANDTISIYFGRVYQSRNLNTSEIIKTNRFEREFQLYEGQTLLDQFTTGFYYNPDDTIGQLETSAFLETEADQRHENDTVVRKEIYFDHYAYDDGSAEAGFGISGEYQDLNKIALRFRAFRHSNDPDYLRAVLIYFAKSIDSVSANAHYKIEIRKNNGTEPSDEALYVSEEEYSPDYSTGINEFTRIEIDPPIALSDTFFIVLHQLDGYLNIGYDINNNNLHNIYTYIDSKWSSPSNIRKGTPMIRASFGEYSLPTELSSIEEKTEFKVYPNPALDEISFQIPEDSGDPWMIQIYSILGATRFSSFTSERSVPVSHLNRGIYFIIASSPDGSIRYSSKFIKE